MRRSLKELWACQQSNGLRHRWVLRPYYRTHRAGQDESCQESIFLMKHCLWVKAINDKCFQSFWKRLAWDLLLSTIIYDRYWTCFSFKSCLLNVLSTYFGRQGCCRNAARSCCRSREVVTMYKCVSHCGLIRTLVSIVSLFIFQTPETLITVSLKRFTVMVCV